MKVILLKDVAKIGRRFEIIEVPDGFALNKLIPKNMAQFATPENVKRVMATAHKQQEHQQHDSELFSKLLKKLETTAISIIVDTNAEGRMFQALKQEAVATAVQSATGMTVSKEQVMFKEPIKSIGTHVVELASGKNSGSITITLVSK